MRKNTRAGVAGRQAVAAIMAGLLGAAGFAVPATPVTALAETHQPSVGTISDRPEYRYVLLTPAEVEALYAAVPDGETVDLSAYYCQYMKTIGYDSAPDAADDHVGYSKFGEEYGAHAGENALYRREEVRETQTGSGTTDLMMILENSGEFGGTDEPETNPDDGTPNPYYNPDTDGDGLGDNLAFTVPASINYVVKADGSLIGPDAGAAYIENRSAFATHVSSLDVDEENPFNIVADAAAASEANAVDLAIGPADEQLSAASYLSKAAVTTPAKWQMAATNSETTDQVPLTTSGHVANISADISSTTKFGEIHWYVTTGAASGSVTEGYPTADNPWTFGVLCDGDLAYDMGVYYANGSWMVYDNGAGSVTDAVSDVVATACLSTGAQRISGYKLADASWVTLSSPVATWTEFMSVSGLSVSEAAGIQSLEVVY